MCLCIVFVVRRVHNNETLPCISIVCMYHTASATGIDRLFDAIGVIIVVVYLCSSLVFKATVKIGLKIGLSVLNWVCWRSPSDSNLLFSTEASISCYEEI